MCIRKACHGLSDNCGGYNSILFLEIQILFDVCIDNIKKNLLAEEMKDLSASIGVYKNSADILAKTIHSFLNSTKDSKLYLVGNSSIGQLKYLANDSRIVYH